MEERLHQVEHGLTKLDAIDMFSDQVIGLSNQIQFLMCDREEESDNLECRSRNGRNGHHSHREEDVRHKEEH